MQGEYAAKSAPVIITSKDRMYRTRLKEAAQQKPNFAGHYILTTWGCGTECLMGSRNRRQYRKSTVDSARIRFAAGTKSSDTRASIPIEFRLNSRLIVFTGIRNEQDGDQGAHFYEFGPTGFKHIRTIKSSR